MNGDEILEVPGGGCLLHERSFIHSLSVTVHPLQGRGGLEPIAADIGRGRATA